MSTPIFHQKGIIAAGGSGSRLHPLTQAVSKQLLPVFDKPMIYYPLSTLMLAGVREYLVITTAHDRRAYQQLLGDGSHLGIAIHYAVQDRPEGIAQALVIGQDFAAGAHVALVLGDNLFYGQGLQEKLDHATRRQQGATVFCHTVQDPGRYGVIEFDGQGMPSTLTEKPSNPRSRQAVVGLYFYDPDAVRLASELEPSPRGELEITDVNRGFLQRGRLHVERFGRGFTWLDMGTAESLLQAANFVETVQRRQGLRIACLEEVAYRKQFITAAQLQELARIAPGSYGAYLRQILDEEPDGTR